VILGPEFLLQSPVWIRTAGGSWAGCVRYAAPPVWLSSSVTTRRRSWRPPATASSSWNLVRCPA